MLDDEGEPFLLDLDRPVTLADGDGLALVGGGIIRVRAAEEAVIEARGATTADAARLAWHLGNRHAPAWLTKLTELCLRERPKAANIGR